MQTQLARPLCDQADGPAPRVGGHQKGARRKMPRSVTLFCYRVGSVTDVGGDSGSRGEMMIYSSFSESLESNRTLVIK